MIRGVKKGNDENNVAAHASSNSNSKSTIIKLIIMDQIQI